MSPCYRESMSLVFFYCTSDQMFKILNPMLNSENEINPGLNPQDSYICSKLYSELVIFYVRCSNKSSLTIKRRLIITNLYIGGGSQ